MLALLSRCAKTISLIAGFVFAILGALWSFLVVERLSEQARALANAKADVNRKIQLLNTLASEYFVANQQGDLVFILAQQENARRDLANLICKGNVLDRATPVRNMIGALAVPNQRTSAREALRNAGARAVPALIAHLEGRIDGDPATAVMLLRDIGDPAATPALVTELERGRIATSLVLIWVAVAAIVR